MENIKTKLEEEKKLLESELNPIARKDTATGNWDTTLEEQIEEATDDNDLADRSEEFETRSALTDVLEKRLSDVNKALQAIENGTYGKCSLCGKDIESDRLEANASASTCKDCMEKI